MFSSSATSLFQFVDLYDIVGIVFSMELCNPKQKKVSKEDKVRNGRNISMIFVVEKS